MNNSKIFDEELYGLFDGTIAGIALLDLFRDFRGVHTENINGIDFVIEKDRAGITLHTGNTPIDVTPYGFTCRGKGDICVNLRGAVEKCQKWNLI
ncbi:hypothetical protein [Staphylococcus shinii]|uniref:hypothetical protein n=1 Tax=Staphylococcus shinii TaxID=2912228 RepID=UPI003D8061A0